MAAVVFGALLVRVAFVLALHPLSEYLHSDMWVYDLRAKHFVSGELGPWDSFTPAGYPLFIASFYRIAAHPFTAIAVTQAILGALTVFLTYRLALTLRQPRALALFAATVIAFHVPAILYTGLLLSETLFSFLLVLASWLLVRSTSVPSWRSALVGGLALGLASVVRPNLLLVYPFVPVCLFIGLARVPRTTLVYSALVLVTALVPVGLHSAHNSRLVDRWVPTSTNGGLNFYLNFSDVRTVEFPEGRLTHRITPVPNLIRYTEVERVDRPFYEDRHFYGRGIDLLREEPSRALRGLWSLKEFVGVGHQDYWPGWRPWSRLLRVGGRIFSYAVVLPALFALGWLGWRRFRATAVNPASATTPGHGEGWVWIGALIAANLLTGMVFLGDPRLRVPYDPLYAIAAGFGYWQASRWIRLR